MDRLELIQSSEGGFRMDHLNHDPEDHAWTEGQVEDLGILLKLQRNLGEQTR